MRVLLLHVFDGFARFLLNALDQVGDFLGGLRRFLGELAHFFGNHRETESVLAGARGFDRRVERQQVGLFGQVVDHLDDLADVVGAMAQNFDNFG